jgi:membrane protein required for colicin V production
METSAISFTGWDYAVMFVFGISVALGLWRGVVRTLTGLAAWIGGFIAMPILGPLFAPLLEAGGFNLPMWVIYGLCFVITFVVVRILGYGVSRAVNKVGLTSVDRVSGGLLGAARALVLVAIVAVPAAATGFNTQPAWRDAYFRPLLETLVNTAQPFLPDRISGIKRA